MKKFLSLALAVMLLGSVAGCGGSTDKKEAASTGKPAAKDELIVATEPSFAPFEFPDEKSKDFTGFDMDLIRAIAKEMGYKKCTIKNMGFDALIPALTAGNIDVAIAGMTITDARKEKVNFSQAYYKSGLAIIVRKDDNSIKGIDDLKGKKLAVQIGTTGADRAAKIEGAKISTFNTSDLACLELKNKNADAVISDLPVLQYFLTKGGSEYAKLVGKPLTDEGYGIAVAKKNTQLAKDIDAALDKLKKNGEYDKLYKQWFGSAPTK